MCNKNSTLYSHYPRLESKGKTRQSNISTTLKTGVFLVLLLRKETPPSQKKYRREKEGHRRQPPDLTYIKSQFSPLVTVLTIPWVAIQRALFTGIINSPTPTSDFFFFLIPVYTPGKLPTPTFNPFITEARRSLQLKYHNFQGKKNSNCPSYRSEKQAGRFWELFLKYCQVELTVAASQAPRPPDPLHSCRSQAVYDVWFAAQESVGLCIF